MSETKFTIESGKKDYKVPVGTYKCVFEAYEPKTLPGKNSKVMQWTFLVTDGEFAGRKIDALTNQDMRPLDNNKLGRFLAGLAGKTPEPGLEVDIADYYGNPYMVFVAPNQANKPDIQTFTPIQ